MKCLASLVLILSMALTAAAEDFDYWVTDTFSFPEIHTQIVQQGRFSKDSTTLIQYSGLGMRINENLSVAAWHKFIAVHARSEWAKAHRIVGDVALNGELFSMKVSNRHRFEYGLTGYAKIYRNKTKFVRGPWFISDEVFFRNGLRENRWIVGMAFDVGDDVQVALYYMARMKKYVSWDHSQVMGLTVKFKF